MTDSKLGVLAAVFVASAAALAFNVARQDPGDDAAAAAGGRARSATAAAVQVIYFGRDG